MVLALIGNWMLKRRLMQKTEEITSIESKVILYFFIIQLLIVALLKSAPEYFNNSAGF